MAPVNIDRFMMFMAEAPASEPVLLDASDCARHLHIVLSIAILSCEEHCTLNPEGTSVKTRRSLFVLCLTAATLHAQGPDPAVTAVIGRTNIDSLTTFVAELSGVTPVLLNGVSETITSRFDTNPGNAKAAVYIGQKLQGYGLTTRLQDFGSGGNNVYATQTGMERPGRYYIICAHYDNMPSTAPAPGADDNASGTAGVIEAARVFSAYKTAASIRYALWDREEQGLLGSKYYANLAATLPETLLGVINLDMIAWHTNPDMKMDVHSSSAGNSGRLADTVVFVNTTYGVGLTPTVKSPGSSSSDHSPFWTKGFGAVMLIEDMTSNFNRNYHTAKDRLDSLNGTYFHRMAKLSIGALAVLAGIRTTTAAQPQERVPDGFALHQNFPNPFNPSTSISYDLKSESRVRLTIFSTLGQEVATLVDGRLPAGAYRVAWHPSVSSGVYFYRLEATPTENPAGLFVETKKMVLTR
jgi:hypothetical protein